MGELPTTLEFWKQISQIIGSGNVEQLEALLQFLAPGDTAYTISHLDEDLQTRMLSMIRPELAAQLLEHLEDAQAADIIEELEPQGRGAHHR